MSGEIIKSLIVPAHPHPVLCPEKNEGWQRIRDAYDDARSQIEESDADLIIIYSTLWPSVIGHQIQADPNLRLAAEGPGAGLLYRHLQSAPLLPPIARRL